MTTIVLVLVYWTVAGGEPQLGRQEVPSLDKCFEMARSFIESDFAKSKVGVQAGCVVIRADKSASRGTENGG